MKGRLEFQNKLQDDFRNDHTSDNNNGAMLHTSTHRMVITANAFSKDKSLGSSMTPLTNTIIYIQLISRHSKTQEVLMPTINGIETRHFFINRTYEVQSVQPHS